MAAEALDEAPCRHQLDSLGDQVLELSQVLDAGIGVVVADPAAQPPRGAGEQLALDRRPLELGGHLALGALSVAKVGQKEAIVGAHDRQSAGPAEPGQPAEARDRVGSGISQAHQIADQELIEPLLRNQGRESLGAA